MTSGDPPTVHADPDAREDLPVVFARPAEEHPVPGWLGLDEDEHLLWEAHPAWTSVAAGIAVGVGLLVAFVIGSLLYPQVSVFLLPVAMVGLFVIAGSVYTVYVTHYAVTNRSLYVKRGILSLNVESVGFERIQNTEYTRSFVGKILGYGTVEIATAGSSGTDLSFSSVAHPAMVRELIMQLEREHGDRGEVAVTTAFEELLAEFDATRSAIERAERRLRSRREEAAAGRAEENG